MAMAVDSGGGVVSVRQTGRGEEKDQGRRGKPKCKGVRREHSVGPFYAKLVYMVQ